MSEASHAISDYIGHAEYQFLIGLSMPSTPTDFANGIGQQHLSPYCTALHISYNFFQHHDDMIEEHDEYENNELAHSSSTFHFTPLLTDISTGNSIVHGMTQHTSSSYPNSIHTQIEEDLGFFDA